MQKMSVEDSYFHSKNSIRVGNKLLNLQIPKVMGIINCTPDSFFEDSRMDTVDLVIRQAEKHIADGADLLDIGGYSTRPGAAVISTEEEISRTRAAIAAIRREFPEIILSIDTFRGEVARQALEAGAQIVNDISGGEIDPTIWKVVAEYQCPYILMHMRGTPQNMQENTQYGSMFKEIAAYFSQKLAALKALGIYEVILDPGFGFSKTGEQNYELLDQLADFQFLGQPILAGISRKSMIYKKLGITAAEALNGTTVLNTVAVLKGASILRVHDVKEAREIIRLLKEG
jgi:dihydropteroate synthase